MGTWGFAPDPRIYRFGSPKDAKENRIENGQLNVPKFFCIFL
jgi:hypothetical protein